MFVDNDVDSTVCSFEINGTYFVGVHGDLDKDVERGATRMDRLCGRHVDCLVSAHIHTPNMMITDRVYLRNGSVEGSGSDYTVRNRYFSNPHQLCMTIGEGGIESVWPVDLT